MINGHANGSHANLPEGTITAPAPLQQLDALPRGRLCSKRLHDDGRGTGWCSREDEHDGGCDGPRSRPAPPSSFIPGRPNPPAPPAPPTGRAEIVAALSRARSELASAQRDLDLAWTLLGKAD
jgi:hypothetical protein